jgi:hypothetical protein
MQQQAKVLCEILRLRSAEVSTDDDSTRFTNAKARLAEGFFGSLESRIPPIMASWRRKSMSEHKTFSPKLLVMQLWSKFWRAILCASNSGGYVKPLVNSS